MALRSGWVIVGSLPTQTTDGNTAISGPGSLIVLDPRGNVRETIPDAVFRFSDDGPGRTVTEGGSLNGELGLAIAPGGDILTVNGGDGNMVETTPAGDQVETKTVDTNAGGGGNLFGLAVQPGADAVYFVDDFGQDNNLQLFF